MRISHTSHHNTLQDLLPLWDDAAASLPPEFGEENIYKPLKMGYWLLQSRSSIYSSNTYPTLIKKAVNIFENCMK